jgi:hypothetical protein
VERIPYSNQPGDLPARTSAYACFNKTKGYERAALWLFKYQSPLTPFVNVYGRDLDNADFINTTDNLALIVKARDLAIFFPGIMDDGAFRRVDNLVNTAVVTGLIVQRPNFRFDNFRLFENVQRLSADGNGTANDDSAFYMLHMVYDSSKVIGNNDSPVGCIECYPARPATPPTYPATSNRANQPI